MSEDALQIPSLGNGVCGEPTGNGKCTNPAGFGRDVDYGPCHEHTDGTEIERAENLDPRSTITPRKIAIIETTIRDGGTRKMGAERAGVGHDSINDWYEAGKREAQGPPEQRTMYFDFYVYVSDALSDSKEHLLDGMDRAGGDDWRMWAWKLERMFPKEFSERREQETNQTVEHTVDNDLDDDDREFLEAIFGGGSDYRKGPIDVEATEVDDETEEMVPADE